jgi:hypothetical protein
MDVSLSETTRTHHELLDDNVCGLAADAGMRVHVLDAREACGNATWAGEGLGGRLGGAVAQRDAADIRVSDNRGVGGQRHWHRQTRIKIILFFFTSRARPGPCSTRYHCGGCPARWSVLRSP